jgi:hypothetical protein
MDMKRGKVLEAAREIQGDRFGGGKPRWGGVEKEGENSEGQKQDAMRARHQHLPKHVRASYERDIDKVQQGFRVRNNVVRERMASGYR